VVRLRGPRDRLQSYSVVESPLQCAQKKVQRSKTSTTLRLDSGYSPDTTHTSKPVTPASSAEKTAEKKLVRELVRDVDVGATHLEGKEHLLQLVQNGLLSEFDVQSCAMVSVEAPVAIHNVGANPAYYQETASVESSMLSCIVSATALMVIVLHLRLIAPCC